MVDNLCFDLLPHYKKLIKTVHPLTYIFVMISLISNFKLLNIAGHKLMTFK